MTRFPILFLLLAACDVEGVYPGSYEPNRTTYDFAETYQTPGGLSVDDPRHELEPAGLDTTVENVKACLQKFVDDPLNATERAGAWCAWKPVFDVKPGFQVKVAPDWRVSCTGHQVFPCDVPAASCQAKGMEPTAECPCACRAIIQDGDKIITAPNLELFPAQLTMLLTGCDQIWGIPRLAECGSPSLVAARVSPVVAP